MPLTLSDYAPFMRTAAPLGAVDHGLVDLANSSEQSRTSRANAKLQAETQRYGQDQDTLRNRATLTSQEGVAKAKRDQEDDAAASKAAQEYGAAVISGDPGMAAIMTPGWLGHGGTIERKAPEPMPTAPPQQAPPGMQPSLPGQMQPGAAGPGGPGTSDLVGRPGQPGAADAPSPGLSMVDQLLGGSPLPGQTAQAPDPAPPPPSNVFVLKRNGKTYAEIDLDQIQGARKAEMQNYFNELEKNARTEDKKAIHRQGAAVTASNRTMGQPIDKIQEQSEKAIGGQLTRESSERNHELSVEEANKRLDLAQGNQTVGEFDKGNRRVQSQLKDDGFPQEKSLALGLHEGIRKVEEAKRLKNGVLAGQIMYQLVHANKVGVPSDKEFERSVGGADIATMLRDWLARGTAGTVSDEHLSRFLDALKVDYAQSHARIKDMFDSGMEIANSSPSEEYRRGAIAYLKGGFKKTFGFDPEAEDQVTLPSPAEVSGSGSVSTRNKSVRGGRAVTDSPIVDPRPVGSTKQVDGRTWTYLGNHEWRVQ